MKTKRPVALAVVVILFAMVGFAMSRNLGFSSESLLWWKIWSAFNIVACFLLVWLAAALVMLSKFSVRLLLPTLALSVATDVLAAGITLFQSLDPITVTLVVLGGLIKCGIYVNTATTARALSEEGLLGVRTR